MFSVLVACEGDSPQDVRVFPEYLPLTKGLYQIYDVHVTNYYPSSAPEQLRYELMVEVIDSLPAQGNNFIYIIHRSTRIDGAAWESLDSWSARKEGSAFLVSEGNTAYVKLKLPYAADNQWDGNAYNTLGEDRYVYRKIGGPETFNGISFEHTIQVEQEDNQDPIVFRDERSETYAAGVGLVYKEIIQLHYCTDDACLGQQKIDHGHEMKMIIRAYGKM